MTDPIDGRIRRWRWAAVGAAGCFTAGLVTGALAWSPGAGRAAPVYRPSGPGPVPSYRLTGTLTSFAGCTDYLGYMQAQAMAEVGPSGLTPYPGVYNGALYNGAPYEGAAVRGGVMSGGFDAAAGPAGSSSVPAAAGTAAGTAASGAASPEAAPASPTAATFSTTTDQVAGVDEPDTVKTDGRVVVTLTGSTLRVLDTSARDLGSVQLPGDTTGGFLLDGHDAIVFSSGSQFVPGTTALPAISYGGPSVPYVGAPADTTARATVVDLSVPSRPQVVRSFMFDGDLVAARMVGQQVRVVLRTSGPRIDFVAPTSSLDAGGATAENKSLIEHSTVDEWLPSWQVSNPDGSTTARQNLVSCADVARPAQSSGIATVSVLNLDPLAAVPGPATSVVGAGSVVYATAQHLYVAGPAGAATSSGSGGPVGSGWGGAGGIRYGCCSVFPPAGASTTIYAFTTPASGPPVFAGSGSVPGWLVNSYAMDEDASGLLRVASTVVATSPSSGSVADLSATESQISVLEPSGGHLVTVGTVGGLGRGESIRAVRYIGDQAFVVTFRTFDPLYVVDLSDPRHPVLSGSLDQPGFSEFLYPLPGQRLLGVGVQITSNEPSGLVVATYDISDPAHPRRIDSSDLAEGMNYAFQSYDPHAFLWWGPADLALLAVPGAPQVEAPGAPQAGSVAAYHVGGDGSLARRATLGHDLETATRSVVIGGQVWVVTGDGVVTAPLDNLTTSSWHPY